MSRNVVPCRNGLGMRSLSRPIPKHSFLTMWDVPIKIMVGTASKNRRHFSLHASMMYAFCIIIMQTSGHWRLCRRKIGWKVVASAPAVAVNCVAKQVGISMRQADRQTDRHILAMLPTDYCNPRCACTPRVIKFCCSLPCTVRHTVWLS